MYDLMIRPPFRLRLLNHPLVFLVQGVRHVIAVKKNEQILDRKVCSRLCRRM